MENAGIVSHRSAGGVECNLLQDHGGGSVERACNQRGASGGLRNSLSKMERRELNRLNIQLALGAMLTFAGLVLLFLGLFIPPKGEIHNSLLIAFGEICTFAGALIGVDYHYRYRDFERTRADKKADSANGE